MVTARSSTQRECRNHESGHCVKAQPSLESKTRGFNHEPGWCVDAQSSTTLESENKNHRQDWCGNTLSNSKMESKPMLTVSPVVTEHPFELQQEARVPEFATMIPECGIWPRHRPLAVFLDSSGDKSQIS